MPWFDAGNLYNTHTYTCHCADFMCALAALQNVCAFVCVCVIGVGEFFFFFLLSVRYCVCELGAIC